MLKSSLTLVLLSKVALAAVPLWGQCGGLNYTGETTCVSGATCTYSNDWYSQCLPSSTTATSTSTKTTTTAPSSGTTTNAASGSFVTRNGQKFSAGGQTYIVVGSNAYWLAQLGSTTDINAASADIAKTGATTVRTWGFNEVTSPSGTYYQLWSGSTPTINTGANGLAKFDTVVSAAKANGLKLIVALTNNWSDYGGMDVYVKQILNSGNHDLFYTDTTVKAAFKNYISAFVGRYKNEVGIMAWELANEPRCKGSTGTWTETCTTTTLKNWIAEMSAYIKIGIGDEGFGLSGSTTYPYQTSEGLDFATNLAISTVDFGTCHSYPESWGQSSDALNWGTQWISDHAAIQKSIGKPIILEEFGVASADQLSTYTAW
ncbi:hypothetical protein FRC03_011972 [Tulasnella sp. 419]|nr:hypothetical protein FRC03_011972 [Tulasnella sp. 419]